MPGKITNTQGRKGIAGPSSTVSTSSPCARSGTYPARPCRSHRCSGLERQIKRGAQAARDRPHQRSVEQRATYVAKVELGHGRAAKAKDAKSTGGTANTFGSGHRVGTLARGRARDQCTGPRPLACCRLAEVRMMFRAPLRAAAVGGVSGALLAALTLEESVFKMSDARRDVYVRKWAGSLLRLMGIEITPRSPFANLGEPAMTGPLLVVANHRSTLDILLMLHLFGGHLLARGDMAAWPGIGALARSGGTLFVDRSSPASGAVAVRRMRERLQRGVTVGVFPEGTTFEGDEVRPFQAGAFLAILAEKGSVLPVGFAYEHEDAHFGDESFLEHIKRVAKRPRTRVGVSMGASFSAVGSSRDVARRTRPCRGASARARGADNGSRLPHDRAAPSNLARGRAFARALRAGQDDHGGCGTRGRRSGWGLSTSSFRRSMRIVEELSMARHRSVLTAMREAAGPHRGSFRRAAHGIVRRANRRAAASRGRRGSRVRSGALSEFSREGCPEPVCRRRAARYSRRSCAKGRTRASSRRTSPVFWRVRFSVLTCRFPRRRSSPFRAPRSPPRSKRCIGSSWAVSSHDAGTGILPLTQP